MTAASVLQDLQAITRKRELAKAMQLWSPNARYLLVGHA